MRLQGSFFCLAMTHRCVGVCVCLNIDKHLIIFWPDSGCQINLTSNKVSFTYSNLCSAKSVYQMIRCLRAIKTHLYPWPMGKLNSTQTHAKLSCQAQFSLKVSFLGSASIQNIKLSKKLSALLSLCEGNPSVTGVFPFQRANYAEIRKTLFSYPETAVKMTLELSVIWEAMTFMQVILLFGTYAKLMILSNETILNFSTTVVSNATAMNRCC